MAFSSYTWVTLFFLPSLVVEENFWHRPRFFTARRYASAVLAVVVCPSVCPSVCLSVCLSVCQKPVLYRNGNT